MQPNMMSDGSESTSQRSIIKKDCTVASNVQTIPVSESGSIQSVSPSNNGMQAKIIQNTADRCVIEVRCGCGCVSTLVGDYV